MNFTVTGLNVLILVALCIPGFLLTKTKLLKVESIKGFAIVLLYVCSPALLLYSFQQAECNRQMLINIGIVLLAATIAQLLILGIGYVCFIKKFKEDCAARVATVASAFGNVGFFGVPVLQALLPDHPEAVVYSAVFIVSMNLLGWTLGMFMLSGDKKHISIKNILINPTTVGLLIALPLFFTNTKLPDALATGVTFFAKMATPLAMTILGIRMASVSAKELFCDYRQYVAIFIKLIAFPLIVFGVLYAIPMDSAVKASLFILSGMPPAAITLNYAELTDTAPKTAANIIILGSLICVITLPLLLLLV